MRRKQEKENKLRDVYNYINDNKISEVYKLREEENRKKQAEELNKIQKQIEDNEKL